LLLCLALMPGLAAVPVRAQEQRSALDGVVRDAQRGVLPGASVDARGTSGAGAWTATTGSDGTFRFATLPPGAYLVVVKLDGFEPARMSVPLSLGETKHLDFVLALGAVAENVQVVAESNVIDVNNSAAYQTIRNELVDKVPRGRDFTSLVTFAPGANYESRLAGISIDGASGAENQFVIDGLSTTDVKTGVSGKTLIPDFVEEVQVKSSGYAAEFGGSTGGVINVLTKSGTNQWTGGLAVYYGANGLDAAPRPTLRLNPADDSVAEYVSYRADDYSRWEPGFTIGGPLKRDRVWLFAGYIPSLTATTRPVVFEGDTASTPFDQRTRTHNASVSLQAQVNQRLRVRSSLNLSGTTVDGALPLQDGSSNPQGPFDTSSRAPNASVSANADYMSSPNLLLAARAGFLATDFRSSGVPNEILYSNARSSVGLPGVPSDLQHGLGFSSIPANSQTDHDRYSRLVLGGDATWYRQAAGRHTFRAGAQYERYANDILSGEQQPLVRLFWNTPRRTFDGRVVRGPFGHYAVGQSRTIGDIASHTIGFFAQDSWSISRVTINGGIRTEHERIPSYTVAEGVPSTAIDFGFSEKLAPRLGFAWDVAGDGRWKAYGSWGVFYDVMKLEMPQGAFGGLGSVREFFTLDTPDWPSLTGPSPLDQIGGWPGTLIESLELVHPLDDPLSPQIDPDLKPFQQREVTFGLEHALDARTSITIRYVHKHVVRTVEDVGIVDPVEGERFFVANPGFGIAATLLPTQCNGPCPPQPPARRKYDGLELRLRRRLAGHWSINGSYLLSRLTGNYSGLASSDEEGRAAPNVTRYGDALYNSYDDGARVTNGRLATDRPHQVKAQGIADFASGTTIGVSWAGRSGSPVSSELFQRGVPFFAYGRGDLGRTPWTSQLDVYAQQEFRVGSRYRVQLNVNVFNLFDQDTATGRFYNPYRQSLNLSDPQFFAGFDAAAASADLQKDARFGKASAFQAPRTAVLGAKLRF
jgi:hypothetical protein